MKSNRTNLSMLRRRWRMIVCCAFYIPNMAIANSIAGGIPYGVTNSCEYISQPDDGDNIYVYTKGSANATVYSLDNLDKMMFGENALALYTKNGKTEFVYSSIRLITFCETSATPTSLTSEKVASGKVEVTYDRSSFVLSVESPEPLYGIQVYDVHGRQCLTLSHPGKSASVSLANLPKGFYIVAMRGIGYEQSVKIIK